MKPRRAQFGDLYPYESKHIDLGGLEYHYLDEGRGEPLILIHGNPTWSFYYREMVRELRDDYRLIAPDHIGCGFSDKPGDERYDYRLKSRIDDLETLLDRLGLAEGITLVMHDWGGAIAMGYAARHPERIARLVIMNTAAFLPPEGKALPKTLWLARNTVLGAFLVRGLNAFCVGAARLGSARGLSAEIRRAYRAPYDSWANRIAVLRFVQDIPVKPADPSYALMQEIEAALERLRSIPALICWGEKDFVFDLDFLRLWERHLPRAEVHRFPDAGHLVLEDAGARIVPIVRQFLSTHALAGRPA